MNSDIMESKTASTAKTTTAVGSVVAKHSDLSNILWKIDNFHQIIANNDQSGSIESDVFSTKDGLKWRLRIFPNGFDQDLSSQQQKFVSIYLLFDDSNPQQTVKARFNFGVRNVNSNMNVLMIETPKTYSFFPGKDWGNRRFVAHDTLLENKEDLLAKSQLTLVCQLQQRLNDNDSKKSFKLTLCTKNNTRTIDAARMIQQLQKESQKSAAEKDRRQALMKNPIGFSDTILLQSPVANEIGVSQGLEAVRRSRLTKINWIIPDFNQKCAEALALSGQARHRFVLKSPEFAVGPDYENRWRLMVYPGSVDKEVAEYVSVYLFMMSAGGKQSEARVLFDFSIVDQTTHEDKHGMESSRVKSFSAGKDWGYKRFVLRSVMLDRNSGMLGKDGELSLTCQIRPDDPVPALTTSHATLVNNRIAPTTGVPPTIFGTAQQVPAGSAAQTSTLVGKHASTNQPVSEEKKNAEKDHRQALVAVPLTFIEETVFKTHSLVKNQQSIAPSFTVPCEKEKVTEDDWDDRDECKPSSKKEIEETLKSLTHNQLRALHKMWRITSYPSVAMRKELTATKSLPDRHIQIWFLNQREYSRQLCAEARSEPAAVQVQSDMALSTPTAKKPSISVAAPLTAETKTNARVNSNSSMNERDKETAALTNPANLIEQLEQKKRILRQQLDILKTLTEVDDGSYSICASGATSDASQRQTIDFVAIYELASEAAFAASGAGAFEILLKNSSRSQAAQMPTSIAADDPASGTATEQPKVNFGSALPKTDSEIETPLPAENQQSTTAGAHTQLQSKQNTLMDSSTAPREEENVESNWNDHVGAKKFTAHDQSEALKKEFKIMPYLNLGKLRELAAATSLSEHQIVNWFENQRRRQGRESYTYGIQATPKTGDAVADIGNTNENRYRNVQLGTTSSSSVAAPTISNKVGDLGGRGIVLENGSGDSDETRIPQNFTPFTTEQLEAFEKAFKESRYPDVYARERIAADTFATEEQIQSWFGDRREKSRQEVGYKRFDAESYRLYSAMIKHALAEQPKVEAMALASKNASKKLSSGIEASRWPEASLENAAGKTSSSAAPIAETESIASEVKLSDGDVKGAAAKRNSNENCHGDTETNVVSTFKIAAVPPWSLQEKLEQLALEVKTLRDMDDIYMAKANGFSSCFAMPTTLESFVSNHSTSQAVKMPMALGAHNATSETATHQLSSSSCPSLIAEMEVSCSRASSFDLIANNNSAKSSECEWTSTISEKEETASQRESTSGSPFVVADMQSEYSTGNLRNCGGSQRQGSVETVANDDNLDSRVQTALSSAMSNISLNSAALISPPSYTIDRASGRVRFSFTLRK